MKTARKLIVALITIGVCNIGYANDNDFNYANNSRLDYVGDSGFFVSISPMLSERLIVDMDATCPDCQSSVSWTGEIRIGDTPLKFAGGYYFTSGGGI